MSIMVIVRNVENEVVSPIKFQRGRLVVNLENKYRTRVT